MRVMIDYEQCENSGTCAMVCPEDVFDREEQRTVVVNPAACTNCWICVDNCVSAAIEIE